MSAVGYAYLREALGLTAFAPKRPAVIKPVTRKTEINGCLAIPRNIAPAEGEYLQHILFALKHEGVNLAILAEALPRRAPGALLDALGQSPNGIYIRKACFLWEAFSTQQLDQPAPVRGAVAPLFDPEHYITGLSVRNARWRIDFNGLGSLRYCATVERTPAIQKLLDADILRRAQEFMASLPRDMMDRAINWAYLHETSDSFAIEKEAPSEDKSRRFIQLLRQAHDRRALSEEYLVELQNSTVSNPLDQAALFRHQQNHLHNGLRGAAGVSYVPPAPELLRELMEELMAFANEAAAQIDPLVVAAVTSFGFVFLHPFMDGNGRLSRFLIHQTLCRAGALDNGLLLPVSVAMKRQEQDYLLTLQEFSRPARERWSVTWLDGDRLAFDFLGQSSIYRFWDATAPVEFTLRMAKHALEVELREEAEFLERYDRVIKAVNERFDIRGSDLSRLVMMCLDNRGVVSKHRRKQFEYSVPPGAFDCIEEEARKVLLPSQDGDD
jgi:hypothetical protein